jgi:carboxyl-terminal processing protease
LAWGSKIQGTQKNHPLILAWGSKIQGTHANHLIILDHKPNLYKNRKYIPIIMNTTNNNLHPVKDSNKPNLGLIISVIIIIIVIALTGLTYSLIRNNTPVISQLFPSNQTQKCLTIINKQSINPLPQGDKKPTSCKEAVDSLGDEYSTFLNKEEYNKFLNGVNNTYSGIGVVIGELKINETESSIVINKVFDNTPAKEAGLKEQDQILSVDQVPTLNIKTDEVSKKIRGLEGSPVKLKIKSGETITEKSIIRKKVNIPNVEVTKVGNIGVIAISSFSMDLYSEFKTKTQTLRDDSNINTILLDLRNNPGGSLESAIDIIGAFTPKETHAVTEILKNEEKKLYTKREPLFKDKKIVLYGNENSASASEITMISLKDIAKAKIIGKKTYGKGVVQQLIDLDNGDVMKLTIAEWSSPTGYRINKKGINPDRETSTILKYQDPELAKIVNEI